MSAGTILSLSGDEIIMTNYPAQSILTLIEEIKSKGEVALKMGQSPEWTDLQILRQIDPKEIGHAITASKYSVELVENYLKEYKFKTWKVHSNGNEVTEDERKKRASEIANQLCNHSLWKSHGRGIKRDVAWDVCRLKITHSEDINLDRVIKRFWALSYWVFENTLIFKIFFSKNYNLMRNDISLLKQKI